MIWKYIYEINQNRRDICLVHHQIPKKYWLPSNVIHFNKKLRVLDSISTFLGSVFVRQYAHNKDILCFWDSRLTKRWGKREFVLIFREINREKSVCRRGNWTRVLSLWCQILSFLVFFTKFSKPVSSQSTISKCNSARVLPH